MTNLHQEQIELELKMLDKGKKKYHANQEDNADKGLVSHSGSGATLLASVIPVMVNGRKDKTEDGKQVYDKKGKEVWIKGIRAHIDFRRGGRKNKGTEVLKLLPPRVSALIAARAVFDGICQEKKLGAMNVYVGSRIEDELKLKHFQRESARYSRATGEPNAYKNALKQVGGSQNYAYRRRVLIGLMGKCEHVRGFKSFDHTLKEQVGGKLIEIMLETTGTIYKQKVKRAWVILPTQEYEENILAADARLELLNPYYQPSLEPPTPWTGILGGGYNSLPVSLVRVKTARHGDRRAQEPTDVILGGLNALQATAWAVDEDVLMTVNDLWEMEDLPLPGVPTRIPYPVPPRPPGIPPTMKVADMTEVQVEQITGYKQARARNIDAEIKRKSKLLTAAQIRALANEYNGRKFYLPMSMDFRGRSYYVPLYLSPMSTSLARGLLRLADGQPFGTQEAVDWFLVTGANHAGADKTNYAGRIQWVKDHHSLIMQTAADPVTNKWWMTVGKESWEFLSWAMEYARWKDEGGRLDFVSHICCNIDATCSGLQILSAMALDEKGGYSVNLTETDEPQDIYGEVAAITIEKLVANSKELQGDTFKAMSKKMSPVEISRICRMLVNSGLIDRGATKRACMTFVYGVTKHGVQDQLVQYFNKLEDEGTDIPFDNVFDASLVLKEVLFEAVKEVVVKGTEVMEWLQEIARVTAKKGLPLRWRTSHGFLVTQSYRNMSKVTVETQISGRCTLILNEYGTKIAPGKQVSSIVPNAVHAIDANLMLDTIYTMSQELPDAPFSAIHDSYGSLACHLPRLSQVVRECFVKLFSEDLLQKFKDDIEADTGLCLDPPENDVCSKLHMPFKGKLVVADVLKSKYFFS